MLSTVSGITLPRGTSLDAIPGLGPVTLDRVLGHLVFAYAGERSFSNAVVFDLYGGYVSKLDRVRLLDSEKQKRLELAMAEPNQWRNQFMFLPGAQRAMVESVVENQLNPQLDVDAFERMYLSWLQCWITGTFVPCTSMRFARFISTLVEDLIFSENWRDDIAFMKETETAKLVEHRQPAGWYVNGACHTDFPLLSAPELDLALQLSRVASELGVELSSISTFDPDRLMYVSSELASGRLYRMI